MIKTQLLFIRNKLKNKIRENLYRKNGKFLNGKKYSSKNPIIISILEEIKNTTDFLPENSSYGERIYYIMNDIISPLKCKRCGTILEKIKRYCSPKCQLDDEDNKKKMKKTNIEKYGVEYPSQISSFQEKFKITMIKKYGVKHALQSLKIQRKFKETNKKKYGVEYPMKTPEVKEKYKKLA